MSNVLVYNIFSWDLSYPLPLILASLQKAMSTSFHNGALEHAEQTCVSSTLQVRESLRLAAAVLMLLIYFITYMQSNSALNKVKAALVLANANKAQRGTFILWFRNRKTRDRRMLKFFAFVL